MITVGDVMNMRAFDSIWLATPCDGAAAREVTGVGTLDHEPFTGGYEVFTQGEFVFTTLGFAGVDVYKRQVRWRRGLSAT